jgi:hypothetical protein
MAPGMFHDKDKYSKDKDKKDAHDEHTIVIEIPGITVGTIKKCPVCGSFINVKLTTCHNCGYVYPKEEKD